MATTITGTKTMDLRLAYITYFKSGVCVRHLTNVFWQSEGGLYGDFE